MLPEILTTEVMNKFIKDYLIRYPEMKGRVRAVITEMGKNLEIRFHTSLNYRESIDGVELFSKKQ